jgi:hypothetical protein
MKKKEKYKICNHSSFGHSKTFFVKKYVPNMCIIEFFYGKQWEYLDGLNNYASSKLTAFRTNNINEAKEFIEWSKKQNLDNDIICY